MMFSVDVAESDTLSVEDVQVISLPVAVTVAVMMFSVDVAESDTLSVEDIQVISLPVAVTVAVMMFSVDVAETALLSVAGVGHVRAMILFLGMSLLDDEEDGIAETSDDELIIVSTSSDNA